MFKGNVIANIKGLLEETQGGWGRIEDLVKNPSDLTTADGKKLLGYKNVATAGERRII